MKRSVKNWSCIIAGLFFLNIQVMADTGIDDKTVTQAFKVQAIITQGCLLGGTSSDVSDFGTIDFGSVSLLNQNKDVVSAANAGSILVKCTPGVSVNIALNSGLNTSGSMASGRLLKNASTNETLRYQLFQEASYSTVWGNGSNGGVSKTFNASGSVETYPIYARLFATSIMPSVGTYTDTVIVTISY